MPRQLASLCRVALLASLGAIAATYGSALLRTAVPWISRSSTVHTSRGQFFSDLRPHQWPLPLTQLETRSGPAIIEETALAESRYPGDFECNVSITRVRLGWPVPCWEYWVLRDSRVAVPPETMKGPRVDDSRWSALRRGVDLPRWWTSRSLRLPLRPSIFRVALCASFYFTAIVLAFACGRHWVRVRRLSRLRCDECGYALEDLLTGPECGSRSRRASA